MIKDKCKGERGSILIMAVVLSFVSILLGVTFLTFAVTLHNDITDQIAEKQALYDAHAAIMMAIADQQNGNDFHEGMRAFYDKNLAGYTVVSRGHQEEGMTSATQYKFLGEGHSLMEDGSTVRQITADFSDESYADYLYISSRERDSLRHVVINFWTPDTLDGKVHSNDTIHIQPESNDAPLFMQRVTSFRNAFVPQGNHARYLKGKGYAGKIIFPDQADEIRRYDGIRDLAWGTTNSHDSLTQLTLSGNNIYMRKCGLYRINNRDSLRCDPPTIDGGVCIPIPSSGCIFIPGKVLLTASRGRGDLMDGQFPERSTGQNFVSIGFSGQLTIASSDTMILGDNIIYQHSRPSNAIHYPNSPPPSLDSCSDILGLISERYIMIGRQVRDTVYINAALAAVVGSISVQDIYWNTDPGNQNPKQSLVIWGSLAQRNRGIVHTTDNPPGFERGFDEKDYHYDWRFKITPPPHFLRTLKVATQFYEPLFDNAGDQGGG